MALVNVPAGSTEATLRTAVETTAVDGDTVTIQPGNNITLTVNPLRIVDKAIRLVSLGSPRDVIITGAAAQHVIAVTNSGAPAASNFSRLETSGISLVGGAGALDGINITGTNGKGKYTQVRMKDLTISGCRNGIRAAMDDIAADAGVHWTIENCEITTHTTRGIHLTNVSMARVHKCEINACGVQGLLADTCINFSLRDSAIEGNNTSNGTDPLGNAQALIKLCHGFTVDGLDVETMPTAAAAARVGLAIQNCQGGTINAMHIAQTAYQADSYGIRLSTGAQGVRIGSLTWSYIVTPISSDADSMFPTVSLRNVIKLAG